MILQVYLYILVEAASNESVENTRTFKKVNFRKSNDKNKNLTASGRRFVESEESYSDESVGSPIINVNNVKLHINMTKPLQKLRKEFQKEFEDNFERNRREGNKIMYQIWKISSPLILFVKSPAFP